MRPFKFGDEVKIVKAIGKGTPTRLVGKTGTICYISDSFGGAKYHVTFPDKKINNFFIEELEHTTFFSPMDFEVVSV